MVTPAVVFLFCLSSRIIRTLEAGREWELGEEEAPALCSGGTLTAAATTATTPPQCHQVRAMSPGSPMIIVMVRLRGFVPVRHPAARGDPAGPELLRQEVRSLAPGPGGTQGKTNGFIMTFRYLTIFLYQGKIGQNERQI